MSSPTRATEPAAPFPAIDGGAAAAATTTTEKPKSAKGRAASKKDGAKDAKEAAGPPPPPAAAAAKEKKEKEREREREREKKADDDADDEGEDGEKRGGGKKRKAGGHGGSRDHPSFEEIIRECIRESKEDRREGVSRPTIKSTSPDFLPLPFHPCSRYLPYVRMARGGGQGRIGVLRAVR
jgi:hypothetical protein